MSPTVPSPDSVSSQDDLADALARLRRQPSRTADMAQAFAALRAQQPSQAQALEIEALELLFASQTPGFSAQNGLTQAFDVLSRTQACQARLAEAATWRAMVPLQMRLKLFKPALHSAASAALLYEQLGEPALGAAMSAGRSRIYSMAEMYAELGDFCQGQLAQERDMPAEVRHQLHNGAATAAYYLANEAPAVGPDTAADALWRECLCHHRAALAIAEAQAMPAQRLFSHVNLAVVCATLGELDECQTHLDALEALQAGKAQDLGLMQWIAHCRLLMHCHDATSAEQALQALEQALLALDAMPDAAVGVREATLQAQVRFAKRSGRAEIALRATMALVRSQRDLSRELGKALEETAVAVMEQPQLLHENARLEQQGSVLQHSLLQRNAELMQTMERLRHEAQIRQAAEAALQSAHDELEAQVRQRSAELQRALQTLMQQEKQLALSRMVAGMAHEMNTPLDNARMAASAIQARCDEVQAKLDAGGLRRADLRALTDTLAQGQALLDRALARVAQLLQRFGSLVHSQVQERALEFDLAELLRLSAQSWQAALEQQAVRLQLQLPQHAPIKGYPDAVRQVLQQLLENSLQHGLRGRSDAQLLLTLQLSPDAYEIHWADNGCGIAAELLPHVLEPFFTTQLGRSGTGLGLASVHSLVVELMAGELSLDSTVGLGTRVSIRLPRAVASSVPSAALGTTLCSGAR